MWERSGGAASAAASLATLSDGATNCSIAEAIVSSLRSAPVSPTSINPTGASPALWHGIDTAQRSKKFAIAVLRSSSRLAARAASGAYSSRKVGAITGTVGISRASNGAVAALSRRIIRSRSHISSI